MNKFIILSIILILNQIELNLSQENNQWQNIWDLIKNFGNENCPRCSSTKECYAECDSNQMREFTGISNWANCKDKCLSLGGNFAYKFDKSRFSDRGCAMYSKKDQGKCVCVPGQQFACRDISKGSENCPQCSNAPECLSECDSDKRREFEDIASWDDCKDQCKSLGNLYTYKWGTWDNDRACAIYAQYDNMGTQGKCVCVRGDSYACDDTPFAADAPPAILAPDSDGNDDNEAPYEIFTPDNDDNDYNEAPLEIPAIPAYPAPETGISFDMIEGYGIGVISTLIILLLGLIVACVCRRWEYVTNTKQYSKVSYIDTEDEQIGVQ